MPDFPQWLRFFHGSPTPFEKPDPSKTEPKSNDWGHGYYIHPDPNFANSCTSQYTGANVRAMDVPSTPRLLELSAAPTKMLVNQILTGSTQKYPSAAEYITRWMPPLANSRTNEDLLPAIRMAFRYAALDDPGNPHNIKPGASTDIVNSIRYKLGYGGLTDKIGVFGRSDKARAFIQSGSSRVQNVHAGGARQVGYDRDFATTLLITLEEGWSTHNEGPGKVRGRRKPAPRAGFGEMLGAEGQHQPVRHGYSRVSTIIHELRDLALIPQSIKNAIIGALQNTDT